MLGRPRHRDAIVQPRPCEALLILAVGVGAGNKGAVGDEERNALRRERQNLCKRNGKISFCDGFERKQKGDAALKEVKVDSNLAGAGPF